MSHGLPLYLTVVLALLAMSLSGGPRFLGVAAGFAVGAVGPGMRLIEEHRAHARRPVGPQRDMVWSRQQLETLRLEVACQAHDRSAALLSVEAVIGLLDTEPAVLDPAARRRLSSHAVAELQRLRQIDSAAVGAAGLDLRDIIEPVVALAKAQGANVELAMSRGVTISRAGNNVVDVVRNLISNAVHHGENKGIVVTANSGDGFVEMSVADGGPGIGNQNDSELFAPFRTSGGAGRSGLGLYSARSAMRAMGGDLWVDRMYTSGARFVVKIQTAGSGEGVDHRR